MSQYTPDEILDMIKANGGPKGLDLSGIDLSGIDLSAQTIQQKREERGWPRDGQEPRWYYPDTQGVDLLGATLQKAQLWGANLQGVDLWPVALLEGAHFQDAILDRTLIDRKTLGKAISEERDTGWEVARHAYNALKVNWRNQGQYDDARWAYIKERRMERRARQEEWWQATKWLRATGPPVFSTVANEYNGLVTKLRAT